MMHSLVPLCLVEWCHLRRREGNLRLRLVAVQLPLQLLGPADRLLRDACTEGSRQGSAGVHKDHCRNSP